LTLIVLKFEVGFDLIFNTVVWILVLIWLDCWLGIYHRFQNQKVIGRFEFLFGFVQIVLTIINLEKLGSFFCKFICCLCLMKQNSDDLHACTMDSVILMKGFEFICPLSKRFFGYFILLNISFLLK
jgi:hypothetical protein